ncbi:hypothetical protein KM043_012213 [Ampulex compressa]|nr:hypothetical protein KM043_012213 [Ampulex compressa]
MKKEAWKKNVPRRKAKNVGIDTDARKSVKDKSIKGRSWADGEWVFANCTAQLGTVRPSFVSILILNVHWAAIIPAQSWSWRHDESSYRGSLLFRNIEGGGRFFVEPFALCSLDREAALHGGRHTLEPFFARIKRDIEICLEREVPQEQPSRLKTVLNQIAICALEIRSRKTHFKKPNAMCTMQILWRETQVKKSNRTWTA